MKQNLKKWLILILVFSYVITTKQTKEDEPTSQNEVSMVEEEREQGDIEGKGEEVVELKGKEECQINDASSPAFNGGRPEGCGTQDVVWSTQTYPETEVAAYIKEVFGENSDFALRLAWCESRFNPSVVSISGHYIGLFQFDIPTWTEQCTGDIWNYRDQILCTKKLIDKGEIWRWPTCGR